VASPNTSRAYPGVIDHLVAKFGSHWQLAAMPGDKDAREQILHIERCNAHS
jgi:hypothetical protein